MIKDSTWWFIGAMSATIGWGIGLYLFWRRAGSPIQDAPIS